MGATHFSGPIVNNGLAMGVAKVEITETPDGSVQNSGVFLPNTNIIVYDAILDVKTAEATGSVQSLTVGRTSTPDAYLDSSPVNAVGANAAVLDAPVTRGSALRTTETVNGSEVPDYDTRAEGEEIVYQADSNDWDEFRGTIYVFYYEIL